MLYAGCDLHKQTITICVVNQMCQIMLRRRLLCADEAGLRRFFEELGQRETFQLVVEATASYEWFVRLVEPLAERVLLAHPKKLRVIAESTRKSDRLDAQVLAEFLAKEMIPTSYRPTPRQREHRRLVRQRHRVQRRLTSVKNRVRRVLSDYNADRKSLFTHPGVAYLKRVCLSPADRFAMDQFLEEYEFGHKQLRVGWHDHDQREWRGGRGGSLLRVHGVIRKRRVAQHSSASARRTFAWHTCGSSTLNGRFTRLENSNRTPRSHGRHGRWHTAVCRSFSRSGCA